MQFFKVIKGNYFTLYFIQKLYIIFRNYNIDPIFLNKKILEFIAQTKYSVIKR